MVERGAAHRSAAELLLEAGALPESAAVHLLRVAPQADPFVVLTLRQAAERSLAQGAADAAVGYLTRALEEQLDPAARAEVLVELGLAERRTNGPAADHLRAGLGLLADPTWRGEVALELGRALWFTDRIVDALGVFERAIGELDLDVLHGGLGSEILLATIAHYEFRQGLHRELTVELARRSLASGNLLASSPIAFLHAVVTLFRSGVLDEVVPAFNQAIAQARRRGEIFNVAFLLVWRGACQTDRGDLRAAVADLREAIELSIAHGGLLHWSYNIGYLAEALLEQGEADEATRVIDRGGFPEQLPLDQVHLVWFQLQRARLRIETGSPERGVEELHQVGETVRLGAFGLAGRANEEIAATGARPRKVLQTGLTH